MEIVLDWIAPVRRARRSDPITSQHAAVRATEFAPNHYGRILAALDRIQTGTAHEIGHEARLTVEQVDRRICELQSAGRVYVIEQGGKPLIRDGFRVWSRTA